MLSKGQVVAVRKAIEMTYEGKCTITEHQKVTKPNKSTGFKDVVVLEEQPCKLSFENLTTTTDSGNAEKVIQITKLLIAPEIQIKPGSKLTVTQNGVTREYKKSGEPAVHFAHQEIMLELFDGWA